MRVRSFNSDLYWINADIRLNAVLWLWSIFGQISEFDSMLICFLLLSLNLFPHYILSPAFICLCPLCFVCWERAITDSLLKEAAWVASPVCVSIRYGSAYCTCKAEFFFFFGGWQRKWEPRIDGGLKKLVEAGALSPGQVFPGVSVTASATTYTNRCVCRHKDKDADFFLTHFCSCSWI